MLDDNVRAVGLPASARWAPLPALPSFRPGVSRLSQGLGTHPLPRYPTDPCLSWLLILSLALENDLF